MRDAGCRGKPKAVKQCTPSSPSSSPGSLFVKGFDLLQQTASLGRFRQMDKSVSVRLRGRGIAGLLTFQFLKPC